MDIYITEEAPKSLYVPPISWEWIENKLVITEILSDEMDFNIGDIVTKIGQRNPRKYFQEVYSCISAGTNGWLNHIAQIASLSGKRGSGLNIKVNGVNHKLIRNERYPFLDKSNDSGYRLIDSNIYYLNMTKIGMEAIEHLIPKLLKSKALICDLRGYPNRNHDFLSHLMIANDTAQGWMQVPIIMYPDRKNIKKYKKEDWTGMIKKKNPYLGNKPVIYLTDSKAISAMLKVI